MRTVQAEVLDLLSRDLISADEAIRLLEAARRKLVSRPVQTPGGSSAFFEAGLIPDLPGGLVYPGYRNGNQIAI